MSGLLTDEVPAQAPTIGDNSGEVLTLTPLAGIDVDALKLSLIERYARIDIRVERHEEAFTRFSAQYAGPGLDEAGAKRAADWVRLQLMKLANTSKSGEIDVFHKNEKAPILAAGKLIDAHFNDRAERVLRIINAVRALQARYIEEQERQKREALRAAAEAEAAKAAKLAEVAEVRQDDAMMDQAVATEQRAEDLASAAAAPIVKVDPVRGEFGGGVSMRTTWDIEVLDIKLLPVEHLLANMTTLRAAVRSAPKRGGVPQISIPGTKLVANRKAV
jgi:hypothetical protein